MGFHAPRRQTPSVPILPLIDILTILLIFFVVTTQFKKKKHTLKVQLPVSNGAPVELALSDSAVLIISKEGKFSINTTQVEKEELLDYLEVYYEGKPKAQFMIEQDKQTPEEYEQFAADMLYKAGFKDISKRILLPSE